MLSATEAEVNELNKVVFLFWFFVHKGFKETFKSKLKVLQKFVILHEYILIICQHYQRSVINLHNESNKYPMGPLST